MADLLKVLELKNQLAMLIAELDSYAVAPSSQDFEDKTVSAKIYDYPANTGVFSESSGRKILNRLVDAKVDVLCDPTLTIGKTKWENIAKRPVDIPDEFILTYFLGELSVFLLFLNSLSGANMNHRGAIFSTGKGNFNQIKKIMPLTYMNSMSRTILKN